MKSKASPGEVLTRLLERNSHVHSVEFLVIKLPAADRHPHKNIKGSSLEREALELRASHHIPFWMALTLTAEQRKEILPAGLIEAAGFHRSMSDAASFTVLAKDVGPSLAGIQSRVAENQMATLSSRVQLVTGEEAHIPMLDFRAPTGVTGLDAVRRVSSRLGKPGVILNSGNSYHYYGLSVCPQQDLFKFLGSALLYTPIVDHRWIGHQLVEGRCALRVSSAGASNELPFTVEYVDV